MAITIVLVSFFALFSVSQVHSSSKFIFEDLVDYVQEVSNPDVIPQTSVDKPVALSMGMTLINIRRVDLDIKEVEIEAWMTVRWSSGILWDPSNFSDQHNVRIPASDIWRPDIAVYNGDFFLPENSLANKAVISYDGKALWVPAVKIRTRCDLNEDTLDTNTTCTIKVGSWTYSASHIALEEDPNIDTSNYFAGSKYDVIGVSAERNEKRYACCPEVFQDITFNISFCKNK